MSEDLCLLSSRFSRAMALQRAAFLSGDTAVPSSRMTADSDHALIAAAGFRAVLVSADPASLDDRRERIAFWINLYNALVSLSIVELGIRRSVAMRADFAIRTVVETGGSGFCLDDIEEGILGGDRRGGGWPFRRFGRRDSRRELVIHDPDFRFRFALDGGCVSSPSLAFYGESGADKLDTELAAAEGRFAAAHFHADPILRRITCSRIFGRLRGELPGRWLSDPSYSGWKIRHEGFDSRSAAPAPATP